MLKSQESHFWKRFKFSFSQITRSETRIFCTMCDTQKYFKSHLTYCRIYPKDCFTI